MVEEAPVNRNVLVVGGGIAGIQASLDIADSGHTVYLVERLPNIGGRMAQLDKTFPTMDCSSCIFTPKTSAVGSHKKIEMMTYCEVIEVSGSVGHFKVKIKKKPRYVNADKCTGCGTCQEKCPFKAESEYNAGMAQRKAIYIAFPQAIPNTPVIDTEHCAYFQKGKCRACEKVCPTQAIDFEQKEEIVELEVGAIIVTTGYDLLDPASIKQFGYGRYDNVITSLEFESLVRSTGPTEGHVVLKDGSTPESVAIVHCVGSRDENYHEYCSRVCCMYGLKHAHQVREKTGADVYQMYIDMRCFGKGYEEFYKRVADEGVNFTRGKVAQITDVALTDEEQGKLVVICEDTTLGHIIRVPVDMVILNVAIQPRQDAAEVAKLFSLEQSAEGFFLESHHKFDPIGTGIEGVFMAGCCQGPKDIPDTAAQASGAAARALAIITKGEDIRKAEAAGVAGE